MMKPKRFELVSVITGDIVNSRKAEDLNLVISQLKKLFYEYGEENEKWEFFRGDSFQLQVDEVSDSFRTSLLIKAIVKQFKILDVRSAIGIGSVDTVSKNISERNGNAFLRSGQCFDELGKLTLQIKSPWEEIDNEMNLHFEVSALISDHWTQYSAEYVYLSLKHSSATQKDIAKILEIGQGRVSDRNKRSALDEFLKIDQRYRLLINQKLEIEE